MPAFAQIQPWWVSVVSAPLSMRTTRRDSLRITSTRRGSLASPGAIASAIDEGWTSASFTRRRLDDEPRDVVAGAHLADALDADHLVTCGHCSGGLEAGFDRGWPEIDASRLRTVNSSRCGRRARLVDPVSGRFMSRTGSGWLERASSRRAGASRWR